MPSKTTTALAALLFFGSASAALANTNNRNDHQGSVVGRAVSVTMSSGGAGAVNHAQKPSTAEEKAGFGTPQLALAERAPFCRPGNGHNDGLDQIDCTRREPDSHQRRTCNFRQI